MPGWTVIGIMALMGFGVGIAGPSRDMLVRTSTAARLGTGAFGRIYGLVYSGLDAGLATAPLIFGMLMDAGKTRIIAGIPASTLRMVTDRMPQIRLPMALPSVLGSTRAGWTAGRTSCSPQ